MPFKIITNGDSSFIIKGEVVNFRVSLASNNSRVMAEKLIAQHVTIFHRSSNDILVNPQQSIKGKIMSTGDVLSYSVPDLIELEELYTGKLILKE